MRYVGSYSVAFYLHIILLLVYTMDEDLNLIPFLSLHLSMYLSTCASLSPTLPSCFYSYLLTYLLLTSLLFFFFFSLSLFLSLFLSLSVSLFLSLSLFYTHTHTHTHTHTRPHTRNIFTRCTTLSQGVKMDRSLSGVLPKTVYTDYVTSLFSDVQEVHYIISFMMLLGTRRVSIMTLFSLCFPIPYLAAIRYALKFHVIPCSVGLCYTILYYTIQYSTILY